VTLEAEALAEDEDVLPESNGYEPLPTLANHEEDSDGIDDDDDDDDDDEIEFGLSTFDGQEFRTVVSRDYRTLTESQLFSENPASTETKPEIPMDETRVETIRNIMSNITIPSSAIPAWATAVPDEQLRDLVVEKTTEKNDDWAKFD